jgi:hypothetical protein
MVSWGIRKQRFACRRDVYKKWEVGFVVEVRYITGSDRDNGPSCRTTKA